ncbi:hypothetical protein ACFLYO_08365 [Chloroflexota bacterium]
MTVLFITNVGNRDVQVPNHQDLPTKARPLGEFLLANWDQYADQIELPILGKALRWVAQTHGQVDQVVLVVSDQDDERFRPSDTIVVAEVIKRILQENDSWQTYAASTNIQIVTIPGNPSDYDLMMGFYKDLMQPFEITSNDSVYLAVSGGTPAMASMLLLRGIEVFGKKAHPLYVNQVYTMPMTLDVGRRLVLDAALNHIRQTLVVFQYDAAQTIFDSHQDMLRNALPGFDSFKALLDHARQRYNFNFQEAQRALLGADRNLPKILAQRIFVLADDIAQRDTCWLLREEIFATELDFRNKAYKDAVSNVFAFREGLLRQLAIQHGTQLIDNRQFAPDWLEQDPDLVKYLKSKNIDTSRTVTTFVFERVLGFKAKQDADLQMFMKDIDVFTLLAKVRNEATHNHEGVSEQLIAEKFEGGPEAVLEHMHHLYKVLTGDSPGPNAFDTINDLLFLLLDEAS